MKGLRVPRLLEEPLGTPAPRALVMDMMRVSFSLSHVHLGLHSHHPQFRVVFELCESTIDVALL